MRGPRPRREPPASHACVLEASEPAPGRAAGAARAELARGAWDVLARAPQAGARRRAAASSELQSPVLSRVHAPPVLSPLSEDPVHAPTCHHFQNDMGEGRTERLPFGGSSVGNGTNPNVQLHTQSAGTGCRGATGAPPPRGPRQTERAFAHAREGVRARRAGAWCVHARVSMHARVSTHAHMRQRRARGSAESSGAVRSGVSSGTASQEELPLFWN